MHPRQAPPPSYYIHTHTWLISNITALFPSYLSSPFIPAVLAAAHPLGARLVMVLTVPLISSATPATSSTVTTMTHHHGRQWELDAGGDSSGLTHIMSAPGIGQQVPTHPVTQQEGAHTHRSGIPTIPKVPEPAESTTEYSYSMAGGGAMLPLLPGFELVCHRRRQISNITEWMQAYLVYMTAHTSDHTTATLELITYSLTIIKASQHYDGLH